MPCHEGYVGACRWGEVSGKHVELKVGDICDFEFFSGAFQVGAPFLCC